MSKQRTRRPGSLSTLADVLPGLSNSLHLEDKVHEMAVLSLWPSLVSLVAGEGARHGSKASRLRRQGNQTILQVKVASAALSAELGFHLPALLEALNGYAPQTGITVHRIQLSVGSLG